MSDLDKALLFGCDEYQDEQADVGPAEARLERRLVGLLVVVDALFLAAVEEMGVYFQGEFLVDQHRDR